MTVNDPSISVIIPTRNRAALLPGVLQALAEQACRAVFEVVIVDNASTDGTRTLVAARCASDPRFRRLHEPVLGRSAAMNAGAASARGALLLFTDDDVVMAPDWIETYRRFIASRPPTGLLMAGGPIHPVASDLGPWPSWVGSEAATELMPLDWGQVERVLGSREYLWGANMALTAGVFERMGGWDVTIGRRGDERGTYEDVEYQDRIRRAGGAVWFCPRARVLHRLPEEHVTPARILSNAFARGRNSVWAIDGSSPMDTGAGGASLVARFAAWAVRTLAFRVSREAGHLERARRAAERSGDTMERHLRRSGGRAWTQAVASTAWLTSRAILRLAGRPHSE